MTSGFGMMSGFGFKQAWLAVRDTPADRIIAELGLRDLGPVDWRSGVDLAYLTTDRVVFTPPLPGAGDAPWTLMVGRWLLSAESSVDIIDLSARLDTEIQSYASHRVPELHQWRRARQGDLIRSFGYLGESGEITDWRGEPDATELAAHLPPTVDDDTFVIIDESDVMAVAAAWSINPVALDGRPAGGPLTAAATA